MFTLGVIKTLGTMWIKNKLFIFVEGNLIEPFTIQCLQCLGKALPIYICVKASQDGGHIQLMYVAVIEEQARWSWLATTPYLTRNHV